jgi:predicted ATPase/DNA-binding CsgD family transcriptional regulator
MERRTMMSDEAAFSLPTGTVTFLLSDVEASSRQWERAPETTSIAMSRHDELLERAIVDRGGVRPEALRDHDTVVAAFTSASDALLAALDAQRALVVERWPAEAELRVCKALHSGDVRADDGRYGADVVRRCALILAVGHGAQILMSATTSALVTPQLPPGAALVDLGAHRLDHHGAPERLWQVVHPDLPAEFPPLRSLGTFHHGVPVPLTPLIGRSRELSEVQQLLADGRLVTLTGAAGVGKTRLAQAVATDIAHGFPGGVWWVELGSLSDPAGVGRAVLSALGQREVPGVPIAWQVSTDLGDQPVLVVLDNCEHVVAACASFVAELLATCGVASVLTTSREPLGVPGETIWRVPSLACPPPDSWVEHSELARYDAVVLFVDRARRARPSFLLDDSNGSSIAEICSRLDGIPLALELAAARCRQMSPQRIANELDDRFRLLTGGSRSVMARQQTLAASLDWSYDRLDEHEQRVFRRLGVFNGPIPLEAAEVVVAAAGQVEHEEVFDIMSRLVDKNLVTMSEGPGGEVQYRLLQTLRHYALERARTCGELAPTRQVHARWWTEWLEPMFPRPTEAVLGRVEEFRDNLRVALEWSLNDPAVGLRLLGPLARMDTELGHHGDVLPASDRLLSPDNARQHPAAWLAAACETLRHTMAERGPTGWQALIDRIEEVATQSHDEYYLALAHYRPEGGRAVAARACELARERGDLFLAAQAAADVAVNVAEDDPASLEPALAAARALVADSGCETLHEHLVNAQALAARGVGDLHHCIALGRHILENSVADRILTLVNPVSYAALLALDDDALRFAVDVSRRVTRNAPGFSVWADGAVRRLELLEGEPSVVPAGLEDPELPNAKITCGTLWLECREGIDAGAAAIAVAAAHRLASPSPQGQAVRAAVEATATGDENRWHEALQLAVDHQLRPIAVDALEGLAAAASRAESWSESLRLLASAERLRDETGYRWRFPCEQRAVSDAAEAGRAAIGDDAADAARIEGAELDWNQAAQYAQRARGERKRPKHGWASLTPTELQIVACIAEGLTNPQIAQRLFISRSTVKTHLEHVFTKLHSRHRSELAAAAARHLTP